MYKSLTLGGSCITDWKSIDWATARRQTHQKQELIYNSAKSGNIKETIHLQLELLADDSARLLATRRVTQDSSGKKTAGVDRVKILNPKERLEMASNLEIEGTSSPIRRVWIPKPGTDTKRPLGIPTILDRARQALILIILEPEWESRFEPHNYGFRVGKSAIDALRHIKTILQHSEKWILDADIEKCFDRIDHKALLSKLIQPPGNVIHTQIQSWLQAGILEGYGSPYTPIELNPRGTPQGGVISPLLANIALHGFENNIIDRVSQKHTQKLTKQTKFVRYADDFVIFAPTEEIRNICSQASQEFLSSIGLNIQETKTRALHSLDKNLCADRTTSFRFLGMLIHQVPAGKHRAVKAGGGRITNWQVKILPHPKKEKEHFDKIRRVIKASTTPIEIIRKINPIIRGWTNYFKHSDGKTYGRTALYSQRLYLLISNWQKRQYHTRRRLSSIWKQVENNKWCFYAVDKKTKKEFFLADYGRKIQWSLANYVQVNPRKSPYDGDTIYWSRRVSQQHGTGTRSGKLINKQKGLCPLCGYSILPNDMVQIDHIIPRALKGPESLTNLQLVHKTCHESKTRVQLTTLPITE